MHVSVSVRFTLKKPKKDYRGLRSEGWTLAGKGEPFSLSVLGTLLIGRLVDFWLTVHQDTSTQEIHDQIEDMAALIGALRIVEDDKPAAG